MDFPCGCSFDKILAVPVDAVTDGDLEALDLAALLVVTEQSQGGLVDFDLDAIASRLRCTTQQALGSVRTLCRKGFLAYRRDSNGRQFIQASVPADHFIASPVEAGPYRPRGKAKQRILADWNGLCSCCDAKAATFDHVIPRCHGGTNAASNLLPACNPCNARKGFERLENFLSDRPERLQKVLAHLATQTGSETA